MKNAPEPKIPDLPLKKKVTVIKLPNGSIRRRIQVETQGPSRTLQAPAEETDIHNIMKKYVHTHGPIPMAQITKTILDYSNVDDYQTCLNRLLDANESFASLPATTRRDFDNNPAQLVKFLSDDKNYDKAVDYGFISPETAAKRKPKPSSGSTPPKDTP